MNLEEMKTCYRADKIAEAYNCSIEDAQIIKKLAVFRSVHQVDFDRKREEDLEVGMRDFIYNHLNELKNIFK